MYMQRACSAPYQHSYLTSSRPTLSPFLQLCYPRSHLHTRSCGHLWHLKLKPPHQSPSYLSSFLTFLLCHFKTFSPLVAFVLVCQAFSISCHQSLFSLPPSSPSSLPTIPRFSPLTNLDTIVGQMKLSHYLPSKPLSWLNCF